MWGVIDAEGEQTENHGHQGLGAWARRGLTDADQTDDPDTDFEPENNVDHESAQPVVGSAPEVPAAMPPLPAWMNQAPAPLPEPDPGAFTDRGELAEHAAYVGDGIYSGGEYAGGDHQPGAGRA